MGSFEKSGQDKGDGQLAPTLRQFDSKLLASSLSGNLQPETVKKEISGSGQMSAGGSNRRESLGGLPVRPQQSRLKAQLDAQQQNVQKKKVGRCWDSLSPILNLCESDCRWSLTRNSERDAKLDITKRPKQSCLCFSCSLPFLLVHCVWCFCVEKLVMGLQSSPQGVGAEYKIGAGEGVCDGAAFPG